MNTHLMSDGELQNTVEDMYDEALCDALYDRATSEWSSNYCHVKEVEVYDDTCPQGVFKDP